MDPETKHLLEETHALVKDNHRMLRAIRRHQWYGLVGTIIFWAIVLALPLYLYQQYLQPLVDKLSSASGTTTISDFSNMPTFAEMQNLINSFKSGQ